MSARDANTALDRAPSTAPYARIREMQRDAALPVLLGVLRSTEPARHLAWIRRQRLYYMPRDEREPRELRVAKLALYVPAGARSTGSPGVTYVADVLSCDVVPRWPIATPWPTSRPFERQVVYRLGELERHATLTDRSPDESHKYLSSPRWSSVLALGLATELPELLLETEREWRLLEALRVCDAPVVVEPGPPQSPERAQSLQNANPSNRPWLVVGARRVTFSNASGFTLNAPHRATVHFARFDDALDFLLGA